MAEGNGNTQASFDFHGRYAALDERVTNIRSSMNNLEGEMQRGFSALNNHLTALSNEFRTSSKTQWPVIWMAAAVVITILGGVGAILYTPVKADVAKLQESAIRRTEWADFQARATENRARLEGALATIAEKTVTRDEISVLALEYRDYKARIENELKYIDTNKLSRNEWEERNQSRDHDIENIRTSYIAADVNLQRQIDVQTEQFNQFSSSLGNGRDVFQRLQSEYDRLRDQVSELRSYIARSPGSTMGP